MLYSISLVVVLIDAIACRHGICVDRHTFYEPSETALPPDTTGCANIYCIPIRDS